MAVPNVGADPINPKYYDGDACARIIEHMPANLAFAVKYAWRLGEKDSEAQEAGKAIWYLKREVVRKPYYNAFYSVPYLEMCERLINEALAAHKLNNHRAKIILNCIGYVKTDDLQYLDKAIEGFQVYIHRS